MATKAIDELPLIVIAGPTASGKTSLAIKLAKQFGGEIICADSRTIYRGMNVGTAKPTIAERQGVPHWGLDLVNPGERFTVADFKKYTEQKIMEIREREHVPFLVGGTGLYIDAVIFDFQFSPQGSQDRREELETLSTEELQEYCQKNNIKLPENAKNKRYLIRAIERKNISTMRREKIIDNTYVVGITTNKIDLRTKIEHRSEQIFTNNVVKEATTLGEKYGWSSEAMTGNVYPIVKNYLDGAISQADMLRQFSISDWRLAKRQMTWLRRNPYVHWGTPEAVDRLLSGTLVSVNHL